MVINFAKMIAIIRLHCLVTHIFKTVLVFLFRFKTQDRKKPSNEVLVMHHLKQSCSHKMAVYCLHVIIIAVLCKFDCCTHIST